MLGMIKVAFCVVVTAIAVETGYMNGFLSWLICTGLVLSSISLFNWGCRVAARRAAERAYDQGADETLSVVERHLNR